MRKKLLSLVLCPFFLAPVLAAQQPAAEGEGGGEWLTDLDEALRLAARGDRYVLVDLYAEWCGWCKTLESRVFSTPEFREFTRDFVLLRVDVDDGAEGTELQSRFRAVSLPTTVVMDANMARVAAIRGFAPTGQFLGKLEDGLEEHRTFLTYYETLKTSEDPAVLERLVENLRQRHDGLRAAEIYGRLEQHAEDPVRRTWLRYLVADSLRLGRRFDLADGVLGEARALTARIEPPAELLERIDILSFYIAHDSGNCEGAKTSLIHFLATHPQSSLRPEAKKALDELERGTTPLCA